MLSYCHPKCREPPASTEQVWQLPFVSQKTSNCAHSPLVMKLTYSVQQHFCRADVNTHTTSSATYSLGKGDCPTKPGTLCYGMAQYSSYTPRLTEAQGLSKQSHLPTIQIMALIYSFFLVLASHKFP